MGEDALAERRRRRLWLLGGVLALAAILVAIGIAFSRSEQGTGTTTGRRFSRRRSSETYRRWLGISSSTTFRT